ncbi:hypothetical protein ACFQ4C_08140 [Larkinella insperata]|uniref:Uncharacterized protein n=1 Tax=Larkinella insperata TaxID=332158 RepID=A0ABW3Q8M1_9BACT|nr:hypothetical protein [Larkinella insperata]
MKKRQAPNEPFDKEFLLAMINGQLESWASFLLIGKKVRVLLFDSQCASTVIQKFRNEGWKVDFSHRSSKLPARAYYFFSLPSTRRNPIW